MDLKNIHIGKLIQQRTEEINLSISRICNFFKCSEEELSKMYEEENLTTDMLLKWSKLLEYDFFRLYTQHLILYSPPSAVETKERKSQLPQFRKSIYTKEIIDFILEQINSGSMTNNQVVERYRIPRTTLYKWINKYGNLKK